MTANYTHLRLLALDPYDLTAIEGLENNFPELRVVFAHYRTLLGDVEDLTDMLEGARDEAKEQTDRADGLADELRELLSREAQEC